MHTHVPSSLMRAYQPARAYAVSCYVRWPLDIDKTHTIGWHWLADAYSVVPAGLLCEFCFHFWAVCGMSDLDDWSAHDLWIDHTFISVWVNFSYLFCFDSVCKCDCSAFLHIWNVILHRIFKKLWQGLEVALLVTWQNFFLTNHNEYFRIWRFTHILTAIMVHWKGHMPTSKCRTFA